MVEIPYVLNIVEGDTLGQKLIEISKNLLMISDRIVFLEHDLQKGTCIVDSDSHKSLRGWIDEQYTRWNGLAEVLLETGVGDVLRGTPLWRAFTDSGSKVHKNLMELVQEEHARREIKKLTNNDS